MALVVVVVMVLAAVGVGTLSLASARAEEPTAASPQYFDIPLADGTLIRACKLEQPGRAGRAPVVLEWTSYNIEDSVTAQPTNGCPTTTKEIAADLVANGYVYVTAQTRGVGSSTGTSDVWTERNGRDGAEVVEWIARQPWSTGRVGVAGCSATASEGAQIAVQAPPSLKAVLLSCWATDAYRDAFRLGGIRSYSAMFSAARPFHDLAPTSDLVRLQRGDTELATDVAGRLVAGELAWSRIMTEETDGEFWKDKSTYDQLGRIQAPVYATANWHDFFLRGTTEWARTMKPQDRLLVVPGWHGGHAAVQGRFGLVERARAWFDQHLRGLPSRFGTEPRAVWWELDQGFRAGEEAAPLAGRFRGAKSWPPPGIAWKRYFLHGSGAATDGTLSEVAPLAPEPSESIVYPTTSGGTTTDPRGFALESQQTAEQETAGGGLATYTSGAVTTPTHIAGPITMTLYGSSTATETDWIVRLLDVAPDGTFRDVTNGWLKSSHRAIDETKTLRNSSGAIVRPYHPHDTEVPLVPLQTERYEIELWQTATEIPAGHRLRVVVMSQSTPWLLQENAPAVNTIHHSPLTPSSILLPLLPKNAPSVG